MAVGASLLEKNSVSPANECDVVVIGGGPAGSTTAALLADRGHRVVLLEKLGVAREVEAIGMTKYGATFVSPWHRRPSGFVFAEATDPSMPHAYQVRRSEFDEILFRRAARSVAEAREGCRVREVDLGARGAPCTVTAEDADGTPHAWRAKFVVDATGRDTLLGNRLQWKRRNAEHASSAMFGHFANARRDSGRIGGNIIIYWFEHGWFWFIPLKDGITSVGAVVWPYYMKARDKPLTEYLMDTIALVPPLAERLKDAKMVAEPTATGNYSYACTECQGENFILVGDAYAFIDPMFSSGVMLATNSGFAGADVVDAHLKGDRSAERKARARFDWVMRRGPREFSWFIYRVTNRPLLDLFMRPSDRWGIKKAILSVLAGDLFQGTPIRRGLMLFRLVYYANAFGHLRKSLAAWRRRAFNISDDSQMRPTRG